MDPHSACAERRDQKSVGWWLWRASSSLPTTVSTCSPPTHRLRICFAQRALRIIVACVIGPTARTCAQCPHQHLLVVVGLRHAHTHSHTQTTARLSHCTPADKWTHSRPHGQNDPRRTTSVTRTAMTTVCTTMCRPREVNSQSFCNRARHATARTHTHAHTPALLSEQDFFLQHVASLALALTCL
jgi:hypothetical protein